MGITEVSALAAAVSHVTTVSKALLNERDEIKRRDLYMQMSDAIIALQNKQLEIVQKYQTLLDENKALKDEIQRQSNWEKESTRYLLKSVMSGSFVRALDPAKSDGEPPHWLCAHCFNEKKKAILHRLPNKGSTNMFGCSICKTSIPSLELP